MLFTFLLLLVMAIVIVPLVILTLGKIKNFLIYHFGNFIGRAVLLSLGIKIKYDYSLYKPDRPAVFITNHASTLDMFIIIAMKLPSVRFVAKKELQYNPLFFILGHITGQIFIDRHHTVSAVSKLRGTYERIKKRKLSLLVAPEGTRKHKEIVGPFKKGAFRMAKDLDYPIVPVYMDCPILLCSGSSLVTNPGTVTLRYYPPVMPDYDTEDESMDVFIEQMRGFFRERYRETFEREGIDVQV